MKKLPGIFYFSNKEIDFLASEIGISSDNQKAVLNIILESKQDVLNYTDFIEKYSARVRSIKGDLDALFRKLYNAKRGIIVNDFTNDGNLFPYKIVITDEASLDFYYYAIEDIFIKTYLEMNLLNPLIFNSPLSIKNIDSGLLGFKDLFIDIKDSDINSEFFDKKTKSLSIFVWNSIIIPSGKTNYLINFSKKIFFTVASNNGVKDIISRISNLKIVDYDKILNEAENNNINFSINILSLIIQNKEEIKNKKNINLPKNWLLFLTFLNHFINNEKVLKDLENEENIKMEECLEIIKKDLEKQETLVDIDKFNFMINEYSEKFKNSKKFLNLIKKHFFDFELKDVLPRIFKIRHDIYFYKPIAYFLFLKEFKNSFIGVKKEVEFRVIQVLKSNKNASYVFTKDGLDNIIKKFLSNNYFINFYFLSNKRALIDIIVDHYKRIIKAQKALTKEKIKIEIAKYLKNNINFLPLCAIYNIDLSCILNSSFKSLSVFKKLFLIFTGKYQSYKEVLSRLSSGFNSNIDFVSSNKSIFDLKKATKKRKKMLKKDIEEYVKSSYLKEKQVTDKKEYTKKEQDEAWKKFIDKINYKK